MKRIFAYILTVIFFITAPTNFAQDLKIGLTYGNINIQQLYEYSGSDFMINTDWRSGKSFGFTMKYSFDNLPLRLNADILYTNLDGAGFYFVNNSITGSPFPVDTKTSMFNINIGAELKIIDGKISPYLGPTLNFFSLDDVEISSARLGKMKLNEGEYLGGGVKTGAEIQVIDYIMLDLSLHYIDFDLFTKSKDARNNLSSVNIMATIYLNL